ncbi:hypothetical protein O0I10_006638 [Lichtheimia ornata]|uniref:Uncharacterized protein n=1 Tax=Lichtheimia ornata TaxID=688661 RepID=A0AAD7XUK6_9FUNG|nr:uncharacterized protein O0I10_006638 [Lichtheimia ornata]KAJ8657574.1 hypothetical protein O0I10_006638 [Lichtheimia ornata]
MVESTLCDSIKLELVNSNFCICRSHPKSFKRATSFRLARGDMAKFEIDGFDPETGTQGCLSWAERGDSKKEPMLHCGILSYGCHYAVDMMPYENVSLFIPSRVNHTVTERKLQLDLSVLQRQADAIVIDNDDEPISLAIEVPTITTLR